MRCTVDRALMIIALLVGLASSASWAQVIAPSTYTTAIHVQGETAGAEYDDWAASGIPIVDMDPVDNPGEVDIANVQIANDNNFIYIHATMHNTTPTSLVNVYLAFDTDRDKTTGFDILQIGEMGSELGYQTDYPFAQHKDSFNLGLSLTGGPVGNGGALIFPFWMGVDSPPVGTAFEWAVPRDVVIQFPPALGGPQPAFSQSSFDFAIYVDQGISDITQIISYTFASAPGLAGDFDMDLDVDGADFIKWQREFGVTLDADDLADWKMKFGTAPTAAPAIASAPEPNCVALAAMALAALGAARRRR